MRYLDPQDFIQKRFENREKPNWPIAVLCFRDIRGSKTLISKLGAVPMKQNILSGMDYPDDRPYVHEASIDSKHFIVVSGCFWGGPQAAILVEELACLGVKYIVGFGAAGSISPELPKFSQIVAARGLATDGTSRFYTKDKFVDVDADLLEILQSLKGKLKCNVVPTAIATVDAIYQETKRAVVKWQKLGAKAINMETTPFYAASKQCGVKSIWLGYISDCLLPGEWDDWWDVPKSIDEDIADITASVVESIVNRLK